MFEYVYNYAWIYYSSRNQHLSCNLTFHSQLIFTFTLHTLTYFRYMSVYLHLIQLLLLNSLVIFVIFQVCDTRSNSSTLRTFTLQAHTNYTFPSLYSKNSIHQSILTFERGP